MDITINKAINNSNHIMGTEEADTRNNTKTDNIIIIIEQSNLN